ncbi:MAG: hypothetical protein EXR12_05290 [Rhodospirillaceae bacterium]|nr:hypothetical protein [Rhodospirillaceae bacterium]
MATTKIFPELPDWVFDLREQSAGVYEMTGTDKLGRSIAATGSDLDALIERCKADVHELVARVRR